MRLPLAAAILAGFVPVAQAACPSSETVIDTLTCSSTISGSIDSTEISDLGSYACGTPYRGLAQPYGDDVYSFTCQASGTVTLAVSGLSCDLDIYVLDSTCSPSGGCDAGSTRTSTSTDSVSFSCTAGSTYYVVVEGYGYTRGLPVSSHCDAGEGSYTLSFDVSAGTGCSEDCDNGVDDDLDGAVDCSDSDCASDPVCDHDADNDGYNDTAFGGDDCNDANAAVNPGVVEVCNGIDDNCDGSIDESTAADAYTYYRDADGDTYGNPSVYVDSCTAPSGYVLNYTDCDDTRSSVHPSATESCNGIDDDCDGSIDEGVGTVYYRDADADGYGTSATTSRACSAPSGYVSNSTDCNDAANAVHPGATEVCNGIDDDCDGSVDESGATVWYRDSDGDGYGNPASSTTGCSAPSGYVSNATDCNDATSAVHPGAAEVCNSIDDDCDGSIDEAGGSTWYADSDGDGFGNSTVTSTSCTAPSGYVSDRTDCDDTRSAVNPAATEVCNGRDDDCDGAVDETGGTTWYADADSDGYGSAATSSVGCSQPAGYVADRTDCDDTRSAVNPGATEVCDSLDNDCDGSVDESGGATWYADADSDGYGNVAATRSSCTAPTGYVADDADCNDAVSAIHPGATELCNGLDDDCDTLVDEDAYDASIYYEDADADGYGNPVVTATACAAPDGYVPNDDDCWDDNAAVYPGAVEIADGVDANCDGVVDETTEVYDDDGDGYAETGGDCDDDELAVNPSAVETCNGVDDDCDGVVDESTSCYDDDGDGYSEDDGDCDDASTATSPGVPEIADNGVDDDCDGAVDSGTYDPDGDGYTEAGGDCNESDGTVHPGATEAADGVDQDCDGLVDEGTSASDDDGDGTSEDAGDCNDADPTVDAGADDPVDGVDNDCDGMIDEGSDTTDDDGDGFTEDAGDCDDGDPSRSPAAGETANGVDDDCDGRVDDGVTDADGDGFAVEDGDCDDTTGWASPSAQESCDGMDNNCDGVVDEGCDDTGGKVPTATGCGCSTGEAGGGLLSMVLVLGATVLRRRRFE